MNPIEEDRDLFDVVLDNPIKSTVIFLLLFIFVQLDAQSLMMFMLAGALIYGGLRYIRRENNDDNTD